MDTTEGKPWPLASRPLDSCICDNICCFPALVLASRIKLRTSSTIVSTQMSSATIAAGRHIEP